MKKSVLTVMGAVTFLSVANAKATGVSQDGHAVDPIQVGVMYLLSPKRANQLQINLSDLHRDLKVGENEVVVFKVEDSGQLDLSIYEEDLFKQLRADGVIKM